MKTKSIIKKIGLSLCPIAAIAAPCAVMTSCSKSSGIYTRYITFDKAFEAESFTNASKRKFSPKDLLLGSNKFSDGNYILIVGSNSYGIKDESSTQITNFLSGSGEARNVDDWFSKESFGASILGNEIAQINTLKTELKDDFVDFSFVTYIDDFDFKFYDKSGHEIFITNDSNVSKYSCLQLFSPFDKWTDELIVNTREFNRINFNYEWNTDEDDPEVSVGDYIRQDAKAKEFREFMSCGKRWFPTSDDGRKKTFDDEAGKPCLAIYRDGKLKDVVDLQTEKFTKHDSEKDKETTSVYGIVNKYFNTTDDEK